VAGRFTDDLYQLLAKDNANKNLISSPLSVDIALSMVYMAAGGKSAQEMRSVLKHPRGGKFVGTRFLSYKHTYINIRAVSYSFIDYFNFLQRRVSAL